MICPICGLNPNSIYQTEEQQKREEEYVKEFGCCSACEEEKDTFGVVS